MTESELDEYMTHARSLIQDGHREGQMIAKLVRAVRALKRQRRELRQEKKEDA